MSGQDERAKQTPVSSPPRATGEELTGGSTDSIAAIRRRWARVTPGRWFWWMSEEPPFAIDVHGQSIDPYIAEVSRIYDAEAIASAPQDIAALLAALDATEARVRAEERARYRAVTQAAEQITCLPTQLVATGAYYVAPANAVDRLRVALAALGEGE